MKDKYIWHVTTSTGHSRKSPKSEVKYETIAILKTWISDMLKGELRGIFDTNYACRVGVKNNKMIEFVISRLNDNFEHTDLVRFVVCSHSSRKRAAWGIVDGVGDAPNVPFCAVNLITNNVIKQDLDHIGVFADFERCIAWAWLEMLEDKKDEL